MPSLDLTRASFDGFTARDELSTFVANMTVTGAPFARNLTPLPTERGGVAFPTAAPDGFDWVGEGAPIPEVDLDDDADVVAVAKLAGLVGSSNEFLDDNELPIAGLLGQTVAASMGPKLDNGLLYGAGPPAPVGILAAAPTSAPGTDFREAAIIAWGELTDAGANADNLVAFASGGTIAAELARVSAATDEPIHRDGAIPALGPGIRLQPVPSMAPGTVLVADTSTVYLVLRNDFEAAMSEHAGFKTDQSVMRIKGRFAVACPTPNKSLRVASFGS